MDNPAPDILLSYYGDDFTGSTDVMESLTLNGIPAALFLQPPAPEEIRRFRLKNGAYNPDCSLRAFGVAGLSRSMSPAQMSEELPSVFEKISRIPSRFFHYKICSTFDSSPTVGNIGHAAELALPYFPPSWIPLLVGAPALNRFCVFGNLFARADGITYRLDRHPTMARHPVTPMHESDLRVHLSRQTHRPVHLLDLFRLEEPAENARAFIDQVRTQADAEYVLFDILDQRHLLKAGELLYESAAESPQFLVGSSGIEYALTAYLQQKGYIRKPERIASAGRAARMVVMAGSCSPVTQKQIEWALSRGFEGIRIDTVSLISPVGREAESESILSQARNILQRGKPLVLYTALGSDDAQIERTRQALQETEQSGDTLPKWQGIILKNILNEHPDTRVVVAGGDTSGHVARTLGIYALEVLAPVSPGAPLCLAHSYDSRFDGLEIALKGGQNGTETYFEDILRGGKSSE
jgi:3-oxoisoapionate kinase